MSTCAARLTILDLVYSKAIATQYPWMSIVQTGIVPLFFLFAFPSAGAACRLQFHLLWRSQINVHAIEGIFETMWES